MSTKPDVSIIYVYFNTPEDLLNSIKTIEFATSGISYEIIIVDNNSVKRAKIPNDKKNPSRIKVITNKSNVGYGSGLNIGASYARGNILLLTNPDILYAPFSIRKMYDRILLDRKIGVLGPQVLNSKNEITKSISGNPLFPNGLFALSVLNSIFPKNKFSKAYWLPNLDLSIEHTVTTIGGACMMIKSEVFKKVNGFDTRFFLFFEESDLCLRIKKMGLKILYYPEVRILHLGSSSMKDTKFVKKNYEKSRFKFYSKYHGLQKALIAELLFRVLSDVKIILFSILIIIILLIIFSNI